MNDSEKKQVYGARVEWKHLIEDLYGFLVLFRDFPGLFEVGDTKEFAIRNAKCMLNNHCRRLIKNLQPLPVESAIEENEVEIEIDQLIVQSSKNIELIKKLNSSCFSKSN